MTTTNADVAWEVAPSYRPGSQSVGCSLKVQVTSANDVYEHTRDIHRASVEHFIVFDLDVRNRVIARRVVGIGTMTSVDVHPRDVYRQAIVNGAAAIIGVHNHPSGDPTPSQQDVALTARLVETGEMCGIKMLDHIVVCPDGFISILLK